MASDAAPPPSRGDGLQLETPPRQSCSLCKRRKLRCNRELPCSSCIRLNFECIYEGARSQQTLRRHRAQKPTNPAGTAASSSGLSGDSSPEARPRPVAKKTLHQSATSTGWSVDQLGSEDMAELEQTFFRTIHQSIPMLHQFRYNTATVSEPRLRPPSYLRYIICALGASVSPGYSAIHNPLYRASRKCLEETELNDTCTESIPLARPQAWILISVYELLQMQFHRWWMSTARAIRLAQVMGLHMIDRTRPSKKLFAIAKDWTELEEQRRTFWQAFSLDRHAAFGHGCPMMIDEKEIHTLLPVSEEAFESCVERETITLQTALNVKNIANLPPSAAAIVLTAEVWGSAMRRGYEKIRLVTERTEITCQSTKTSRRATTHISRLFFDKYYLEQEADIKFLKAGHRLKILQQDDFDTLDRQSQDKFWEKINWLDETLHYAFSVPPHLAASGYMHTPILTYLHMCAPSSTILLHQAAEEQASSQGITPSSLLQSQALRLAAAEMVASTMRLAEHIDIRLLHPFTGVALVTAAKVFMRSLTVRTDDSQQRSLKVLFDAMGQLQALNPLTGGYFKELDAEFPGMRKAMYSQMQGAVFRPKSETPSTASSYTPPLQGPQDFPFSNVVSYVSEVQVELLRTGSGLSTGEGGMSRSFSGVNTVHGGHENGDESARNLYFSDRDFFGP